MEAIVDFDSWLLNFQPTEVKYYASYDPTSGSIHKVGNQSALSKDLHIIEIDSELAEKIIQGEVSITRCFVNTDTNTVEVAEVSSITKIYDVLHRVIDIEYSMVDKHDLKIIYDQKNKTLTLDLLIPGHWADDTLLNFYLTDYNDPNVIYKNIDVVIAELKVKPLVYRDINLPPRFSVYTKRLFKNYVLEIV